MSPNQLPDVHHSTTALKRLAPLVHDVKMPAVPSNVSAQQEQLVNLTAKDVNNRLNVVRIPIVHHRPFVAKENVVNRNVRMSVPDKHADPIPIAKLQPIVNRVAFVAKDSLNKEDPAYVNVSLAKLNQTVHRILSATAEAVNPPANLMSNVPTLNLASMADVSILASRVDVE